MSAPRKVQMVTATGPDSFPAVTITAAVPASIDVNGRVLAPVDEVPAELAREVAGLLAGVLPHFAYGIRPLAAGSGPWTHWLRIFDEDYHGPREWIVQASGFPATALEAEAQGLEYAELLMGTVDRPTHGRMH